MSCSPQFDLSITLLLDWICFSLNFSFLIIDTYISSPSSVIPSLYLLNHPLPVSWSPFSLPFVLLKFHPYPLSHRPSLSYLCLVTCLLGVSVLILWSTADWRTSLPSNMNRPQELGCHIHASPFSATANFSLCDCDRPNSQIQIIRVCLINLKPSLALNEALH